MRSWFWFQYANVAVCILLLHTYVNQYIWKDCYEAGM